jgi:hypothetical protein
MAPDASTGPNCGPRASVDCDPEIAKSTASEFELRNKKKARNFIVGELVSGGELSFIIENLPHDGKGCPGKWMFDAMMRHFGSSVQAIQGNWTYGVNLAEVNVLTGKGSNFADAALQTYTAKRAQDWGFSKVNVLQAIGSAGSYTSVNVVFTR